MRPNDLLLDDITRSIDDIAEFIAGRPRDEFLNTKIVQAAVLQRLGQVGEAASQLPTSFRQRHPTVPWRSIIDFRNVIIHYFFGIDMQLVWVAATVSAPALRQQVAAIRAVEFPDVASANGGPDQE
jgi:uncharacterized protein with HEPN domain